MPLAIPPAAKSDDPCQDEELARLHDWFEAELDQLIVAGIDADTAARAMVTVGAIKLGEVAGRPDARAFLEVFRAAWAPREL